MDSVSIAHELAAQGFNVFPLVSQGKTPAIAGFKSKATDNPDGIDAMWTTYDPEGEPQINNDYNVGVYTGRYRGMFLLVLDVDTKDGKLGEFSLNDLEAEHGKLPETYTVRTASGGLHYYFLSDVPVRSSASRVGQDLDVRGDGGYVVGPGSVVPRGTYEVIVDVDMATAPGWLVKLAGTPKKKESGQAVAELDTGPAMHRATRYLIESAPEAVEGCGGDETTYKVAVRVADFGVSQVSCLHLMNDVWNPLKAHPQWEPEELEKKVANAYHYRENKVGASDPKADFANVPIPVNPNATTALTPPTFTPKKFGKFNSSDIPPRVWILGHFLMQGVLTLLLAPGGVGKSTLTLQWGMALVTGNSDIAGAKVHTPGAVLFINNEDDENEMRRRLSACRQFFSVEDQAALDKLYFYSGVEKPFIIGGKNNQNDPVQRGKHMEELMAFIKEHDIKAVIVDPFVETHRADENDNQEINTIARYYREVATRCQCSVTLVHHTRKPPGADSSGHVGNMDSGRGASSLTGAARIVLTLYEMGKDDAEEYGIPAKERSHFVRLDDAKANFAPKDTAACWFRKVGVKIPNGDNVGILNPTVLKAKEQMVLDEVFQAFSTWPELDELRDEGMSLAAVAKVLTDGRLFCGAKQGEDGGFPSDKTVLRHLRKVIPDDERIVHGEAEAWTEIQIVGSKETRMLRYEQDK